MRTTYQYSLGAVPTAANGTLAYGVHPLNVGDDLRTHTYYYMNVWATSLWVFNGGQGSRLR
jgi:hypothetical protein